jgi:hypothetical protein
MDLTLEMKMTTNDNFKITEYPNGSKETWCINPQMFLEIKAPNPFGGTWTMNPENKIYGAGGNVDAQGIRRRGKKWYPVFHANIGWEWQTR